MMPAKFRAVALIGGAAATEDRGSTEEADSYDQTEIPSAKALCRYRG